AWTRICPQGVTEHRSSQTASVSAFPFERDHAREVAFLEVHIYSETQPVLASGAASRQVRSRFPTATTNRLPSGKRTASALTLRHTSSKSRSSARLLKAHNSRCTSLAVVVSHPPSLKKGNKRCHPQC